MVQSAPPQGFRPVQKKRRWGCALFYCNWKGRPGKCHAAILRIGEVSVDRVTAPLQRFENGNGCPSWLAKTRTDNYILARQIDRIQEPLATCKIQTLIDLARDFDGTNRFHEFPLRLPSTQCDGHARQISIEPWEPWMFAETVHGSYSCHCWEHWLGSLKHWNKMSVLQDPRSFVASTCSQQR